MSKTLLTRDELAAWLTAELRKVEGFENCSISQIMRLRDPDEDGCNWSTDPIYV